MARAAAGGVDKGSGNQEGRRVVGLDVVGHSVYCVGEAEGFVVAGNQAVGKCVGVSEGLGDRSVQLVGEGVGDEEGIRVARIFLGAFVPIVTVGVAAVGAWVGVAVLGPRFGAAARPAHIDIFIYILICYIIIDTCMYTHTYIGKGRGGEGRGGEGRGGVLLK